MALWALASLDVQEVHLVQGVLEALVGPGCQPGPAPPEVYGNKS